MAHIAIGKGGRAEEKVTIFFKGEFLALRNENGSFFVCQAAQNVYKSSRRFKIRWLSRMDSKDDDLYTPDFYDFTDFECVLTNLRMEKRDKNIFRLPKSETVRTENILRRALNLENGIHDPDPDQVEQDGDVSQLSDETPPKKVKTEKGATGHIEKVATSPENSRTITRRQLKQNDVRILRSSTVVTNNKKKSSTKVKMKSAYMKLKSKPSRDNQDSKDASPRKDSKVYRSPRNRKNSLREKLKPNSRVSTLNKDPTFESNVNIPVVSVAAYSKLPIRAVLTKDMRLLQSLINDTTKVCSVHQLRSVDHCLDALSYALITENHKAIQLLLKEKFNPKKRVRVPESLLVHRTTGRYTTQFLGHALRDLTVSRGSKEGNNALIKDRQNEIDEEDQIHLALRHGVSKATFDVYFDAQNQDKHRQQRLRQLTICELYRAVRYGHRKLAGQFMEEALKMDGFGFNNLHKEVLLFEKQELPSYRAASVKKKALPPHGLTPIHCAAINPNPKYLSTLLSIEPEFQIADRSMRRPIHYAAACEGTGPLDFLLSRGIRIDDVDNEGHTPLHIAADAGRAQNVELILRKARQEKKMKESVGKDHGLAGINRPNRLFWTPLHLACMAGHIEVVRVLLKYNVDIERPSSAAKHKLTPLMLACQQGHLDIMKLLICQGAKIEARDKFKRTALIHAVMNGHAHIASHLLRSGADPDTADSSGNTVVHYASAYGWWFCLKLLLESGANPNIPNDWTLTPLGVAFLKGHMGLVDLLLEQPEVDVNFKDEKGLSLLMLAVSSPLSPVLVEQVQYLLEALKADCTSTDPQGNTAYHWLASNSVRRDDRGESQICAEAVASSLEIAKLLLKFGCDPSIRNEPGQTALTLAIEQGNNELVKLLLRDGCQVTAEVDDTGENLLHNLVEHAWETDLASLIHIIKDSGPGKKPKRVEEEFEINKSKPEIPFLHAIDGGLKAGDTVLVKGSFESASEGITLMLLKGESVVNDDVAFKLALQPKDGTKKMDVLRACRVDGKWLQEEQDDTVPFVCDGRIIFNIAVTAQKDLLQISLEGNVHSEFTLTAPIEISHLHINGNITLDFVQIKRFQASSKYSSAMSCPAEVLLEMAQTYSYDGFTPLLLACRKYHHASEKKQQARLREMIKSLIEEADSEIHAVVKKRSDDKSRPIDGYSVLHFLASAKEVPVELNGAETPVPTLQLVLSYKPPLNIRDNRGRTPLINAILSGQATDAEALINAGADVNLHSEDEEDDGKASPIVLASKLGLVQVVKLLLKHQIDVNVVDQKNLNTALHYAVCLKSAPDALEVVRLLVKSGVKVNSTNKDGLTPLHMAVNACTGSTDDSVEIEDYLIENGANLTATDSYNRLPLHYAFVKFGKRADSSKIDPIEVVSLLTGAMKNMHLDAVDKFKQTPLHCAAFRGATICCMRLAKGKMSNVNSVDANGNTALSLAILGGHESCAIMLLQSGALIHNNVVVPIADAEALKKPMLQHWRWKFASNNTLKLQHSPILQEVASKDWQGVMYMMLDQLQAAGNNFYPAVEAALNTNKFRLALSLISRIKEPVRLQACNSSGQNFLHILALKAKPDQQTSLQIRVAEYLVQQGLCLTKLDDFGSCPLIYAAINKNTTLCNFFTEKIGKETVIKMSADKLGRTPVNASFWWLKTSSSWTSDVAETNFRKWCESLIQSSLLDELASFPSPNPYPGHVVHQNSSDPNITLKQEWRLTPLIHAVCCQDVDLVLYLLRRGANVNKPDSNSWTPIMHAVRMNNMRTVKLLMNYDYLESKDSSPTKANPSISSPSKLAFRDAIGATEDEDANSSQESCDNDASRLNGTEEMETNDDNDNDNDEQVNHNSAQEEELEIFKKTSDADLSHKDKNGCTVVHVAIQPYPGCSYENVALVELLGSVGAPISEPNKLGITPLQLAIQERFTRIIPVLQKCTKAADNLKLPTLSCPAIEDGLNWDKEAIPWNYKEDAASFRKQKGEVVDDVEDDQFIKPDAQTGLEDTGEIIIDGELGLHYDVLMTKVDLNYGVWGRYNFYKLQIIRQKGKDLYILFTRWGRIGTIGQFQQTPYRSLEEATKEFCKIFKSKSGNNWQDVKSFQPHTKKYQLVTFEKRKRHKLKDFSINLESTMSSALPAHLQELMQHLTNVRMLQEACRDSGIDIGVIPVGHLSESMINKGREILLQLKELVTEKTALEDDIDKKERLAEVCEKIIAKSNEYYQTIPQFGYAYEKVQPLDNMVDLQMCNQQIENLAELEVTTQMLLGAQFRLNEVNPMDYIYRSLNCKIAQMREDEKESQYILQYIYNTADENKRPVVDRIYRLSRAEELQSTSDLENRWLLWHGTSPANLVNILARGLQCGNPNLPPSTPQFNRGVYFSDTFDYSQQFVSNLRNSETRRRYILLCEVSLGKVKEKVDDDFIQGPVQGYDSIKLVGTHSPDPTCNLTFSSGSTIPLGAQITKFNKYGLIIERSYNNNEYIVFDRKQVRLRYLVHYYYENEYSPDKHKQVPTHT